MRPPGLDDGAWWERLASMLRPGGVLVVNFLEEQDLIASDLCQLMAFRRRFPAAIRFGPPAALVVWPKRLVPSLPGLTRQSMQLKLLRLLDLRVKPGDDQSGNQMSDSHH